MPPHNSPASPSGTKALDELLAVVKAARALLCVLDALGERNSVNICSAPERKTLRTALQQLDARN